ncbi:MAG: hypothetical protein ACYDDU_11560 [Dermatophilaceae bacterium]
MTGWAGTRRIVVSAAVLAVVSVVAVMMLAPRSTSSAMAGMDHASGDAHVSSPAPTDSGDMPGMDMPGTGSGSGNAHVTSPGHSSMAGEASPTRPLAPVLGTFGGGTSAVLLAAGFLRRKDRARNQAKTAARAARRSQK